MTNLEESPAWQALVQHQQEVNRLHMWDLFARDPQRFARFSLWLGTGNLALEEASRRLEKD